MAGSACEICDDQGVSSNVQPRYLPIGKNNKYQN